jgi:hypothetical protein
MPLEILPNALYSLSSCKVVIQSKKSVLFHKSISSNLVDKKMYISSLAVLLVVKGEQVIHNYDSSSLAVSENEIILLPKDLYIVSDFVTEQNIFEAFVFFVDN